MSQLKEAKSALAVGATSAIVKACLQSRASQWSKVALIARDEGALRALAAHLEALSPGLQARWWSCDVADVGASERAWREASDFCGRVDEAVVAAGALGEQRCLEENPAQAAGLLALNSAGCTAWALWVAQALERQGGGVLAIVTSVAGMRGRASNYIYGSSKAQLISLAQGLRWRLWKGGTRVIDFRPGMVDTPMTAGLPKGPLMADAKAVGLRLARSLEDGDGVVYAPGYWRWVMWVIKSIPFWVIKRSRL